MFRCSFLLILQFDKIMIWDRNVICVVVSLRSVISILGQWQVPFFSGEQWDKLSRIFLFIGITWYLINWYSQTLDVIVLFADSIILQSFTMTIYAPKIYYDTLLSNGFIEGKSSLNYKSSTNWKFILIYYFHHRSN